MSLFLLASPNEVDDDDDESKLFFEGRWGRLPFFLLFLPLDDDDGMGPLSLFALSPKFLSRLPVVVVDVVPPKKSSHEDKPFWSVGFAPMGGGKREEDGPFLKSLLLLLLFRFRRLLLLFPLERG